MRPLSTDQKIINNDVSLILTAGNEADKLTDRHFDLSLFFFFHRGLSQLGTR